MILVKSLIEEFFPVREVSENSAKERSIHYEHISMLHVWWSRCPLLASFAGKHWDLPGAVKNRQFTEMKDEE